MDGLWQSKRDAGHVADLDEVTWVDGRQVRFLNPEVVLLFKAAQDRAKDRFDLDNTWPAHVGKEGLAASGHPPLQPQPPLERPPRGGLSLRAAGRCLSPQHFPL